VAVEGRQDAHQEDDHDDRVESRRVGRRITTGWSPMTARMTMAVTRSDFAWP